MNKKGEFDWGLFGVLMFIALLIGLLVFGVAYGIDSDTSKYENLCEKKGMEYFTYRSGRTLGSSASIICLDDEGTQVKVQLK